MPHTFKPTVEAVKNQSRKWSSFFLSRCPGYIQQCLIQFKKEEEEEEEEETLLLKRQGEGGLLVGKCAWLLFSSR